jgi:DNA-directed RNA polymerase specialized sigma24 family protein
VSFTDDQLLPLIEGMASGDKTALRSFVEQVGPVLHAVHLRSTGQSVAAAVLTERSLEELWRHAPLYDAHYGRPRAWVMAVARMHSVDFVARRRGKEERLKSISDAAVLLSGGDPGASDPAAAAALGGLVAQDREFLVDLWHRGIPGGAAGEASRSRISDLLPRWAALLAQGTL